MKIQLFLSSSLLIGTGLIYSTEGQVQQAQETGWAQAHVRIRERQNLPGAQLSCLEVLPQNVIDTIAENSTYEKLTRLAETSTIMHKKIEPTLRKKLVDYWKTGKYAFVEMSPEVPEYRMILLAPPHKDVYTSIAFFPHSRTLATRSAHAGCLLWEIQPSAQVAAAAPRIDITGKKATTVQQLKQVPYTVTAVRFSPDGTVVAGADNSCDLPNKRILLWSILTGELLDQLEATPESIHSMTFSPDGTLLASEAEDYQIQLWDLKKRTAKLIPATSQPIMAFSPDGKMFAALIFCNNIILWTIAGKEIKEIKGPAQVESIAFSPDSSILAIGYNDNKIRLWSTRTEIKIAGHRVPDKPIKVLEGHNGLVDSLAFSPHGSVLASASAGDRWNEGDKTIRLWDVTSGSQINQFDGTGPLAFSLDGKLLAANGKDGSMGLWQAY